MSLSKTNFMRFRGDRNETDKSSGLLVYSYTLIYLGLGFLVTGLTVAAGGVILKLAIANRRPENAMQMVMFVTLLLGGAFIGLGLIFIGIAAFYSNNSRAKRPSQRSESTNAVTQATSPSRESTSMIPAGHVMTSGEAVDNV